MLKTTKKKLLEGTCGLQKNFKKKTNKFSLYIRKIWIGENFLWLISKRHVNESRNSNHTHTHKKDAHMLTFYEIFSLIWLKTPEILLALIRYFIFVCLVCKLYTGVHEIEKRFEYFWLFFRILLTNLKKKKLFFFVKFFGWCSRWIWIFFLFRLRLKFIYTQRMHTYIYIYIYYWS